MVLPRDVEEVFEKGTAKLRESIVQSVIGKDMDSARAYGIALGEVELLWADVRAMYSNKRKPTDAEVKKLLNDRVEHVRQKLLGKGGTVWDRILDSD